MKLKYKLIPLASIGAICATVTPLITSCGTGAWASLTNKFIPTIAQYPEEGKKMTYAEVNKAYLDALIENKDIFKEDYLWGMSNMISEVNNSSIDHLKDKDPGIVLEQKKVIEDMANGDVELTSKIAEALGQYEYVNEKIRFKFDRVKINVTNVSEGINNDSQSSVGLRIPLISYDIEYKYDYTNYQNGEFEGSVRREMTGKCHYENIPFVAEFNSNNKLFYFYASCPTRSALIEDLIPSHTFKPEGKRFMSDESFYHNNSSKPWKVTIEYSSKVTTKGELPIVGKVNLTEESENTYSISASEYFDNWSETVERNFNNACRALYEDGWIRSYYLMPVGYQPGR